MHPFKAYLRTACQQLLGFPNYLFLFSVWNIARIRWGGYEKEFIHFLRLLPSHGTVLDIGANIGIMTTLLAKKANALTVYAFEPVPENIRAMKKVIRFHRLSNVKIFSNALGDSNSMEQMIMPVIHHAKMQGLSHVVEPADKKKQGQIFSIPMRRMDDMAELQELEEITAIKIDVENFEYYVLKGGQGVLKKHRPLVFCELWGDGRRALCIDLMKSLDYRVAIYHQGKLIDFDGQPAINFFFIP